MAGRARTRRVREEWLCVDYTHATTRLVTEPPSIERAHTALRAKYGWQMWLTALFSRLAGRIRRRARIEIEVGTQPGKRESP